MTNRSIFFVFLTTMSVESFFAGDLKTKQPTSTDILNDSQTLHHWIIEYDEFMLDSISVMEAYLDNPSTEGIWQIKEKHIQFWHDIIDRKLSEDALRAVSRPNKEHVNYVRFMRLYSEIFLQKSNSTKQACNSEIPPNQTPPRVVVQQRLWKRFLRLVFGCLPFANLVANPDDYQKA